ncbi:hypothetical protein IPM44_02930 [bacterium]|nr:MAG: hypothetical protein IPM44_02930 [bacterium]
MSQEVQLEYNQKNPVALIEGILREVDIAPSDLDSQIRDRLVLLADQTETVTDEISAIRRADDVFRVAERRGHAYSSDEKHIVRVGTLLTDIGKTGPPEASMEQAQLFVDIYALENLPTEVLMDSLNSFFMVYFPQRAESFKAVFDSLGIDCAISLREFYDLHTEWTLKLLINAAGIPREPIAGAVSHHRMRDDNPDGIFDEGSDVYNQKYNFGENSAYDRAEKLINILDIYDALCRRSGLSHIVAMSTLREIAKHASGGRYAQDPEILEILDDLDATASLSEQLELEAG